MKKIIVVFLFVIASIVKQTTFAQAGSLDASFGTGGIVTTTIGSSADARSVKIQPDNKIVVAGFSDWDFSLARYNIDGTLDNSFDTDGIVTTAIGSFDDNGYEVVLQPDGKIVIAGTKNSGFKYDCALVRYNSDGSLDATFGTDGKVTTAIGSGGDNIYSIALQTDGKVIAGGFGYNGSDWDFSLVRFNTNGSLDASFGTGGKVTTTIGSSDDNGYSIAIQSDGKILLAGDIYNGADYDFALVRYNTNGTLDGTFGTGGKVVTAIGSYDDGGRSVGIQSDGKIVVGGFSSNGFYSDFALIRYNTNGTLDGTFGVGGKVVTAIGSYDDFGFTLEIQPDDKILVAGQSSSGTKFDFALIRYNTNGTLDGTFGTGGKVTTAIGITVDGATSAAIQADGKIVVAGISWNGINKKFALVRYNGDPVGIEENNLDNLILIYPNPTNGKLKINNEGLKIKKVEVYNLLGEKVYSSLITYNPSLEIDLSNQPNGIYFLVLNTAEGKVCKKIIKE